MLYIKSKVMKSRIQWCKIFGPGHICVSLLRVASGPRVKLAGGKSALNPSPPHLSHPHPPPPAVYSTDRSKAVVPVVYSTRRFVVCLSVCHFVLVFFSPFSIAITSLGEES